MNPRHSPVTSPSSAALIDAVLEGYVAWREESAGVHVAYGNWRHAPRDRRPLAFVAYSAALEREEYAAGQYQRLIERAERHVSVSEIRSATG